MKDARDLVERDGGSDEDIGWKDTDRDDGRCSVLIGELGEVTVVFRCAKHSCDQSRTISRSLYSRCRVAAQ